MALMDGLRSIARPAVRFVRRAYQASGGGRCCYACKRTFRSFRPLRERERFPLSPSLRMIGGGGVVHCMCPFCESTDRDRHLLMYIDRLRLLEEMDRPRVLHFAPEPCLAVRIAGTNPAEYIQADFNPRSAEVRRMDITRIPFEDDRFDLVVANHVLEHVPDDAKALSEVYRVLKPGGVAILQTPYAALLHNTFSDPGIASEEQRLHLYGQEDHLRIYGQDLFAKIEGAGFTLRREKHSELLADVDVRRHCVNPEEDLTLAVKPTSIGAAASHGCTA